MDFAVAVIRLAQRLPTDDVGHLVRLQILRSGTAPAPNYGEAQSAESRSDFIQSVNTARENDRRSRPARKPPHHGSRANTEPGTDRTDKT